MSLKDDFLEAWRSVKRDFFRDTDHSDQQSTPIQKNTQQTEGIPPVQEPFYQKPEYRQETAEDVYAFPEQPDDVVFEAFKQASSVEDSDDLYTQDEDAEVDEGYGDYGTNNASPPYQTYEPDTSQEEDPYEPEVDGRAIFDQFENGPVFSDDKTIISRNTVIRGALQTEDSVRLLGQVMGDIDCKSNIVVAGKVRGNTSAANAYIFDAQVDGDVRCEDVINISNDAWVLGNIRAQQAEIDGKIKGNIEIRHMVSIGSASSVLGDISADELEIKRGAFVNGQIMMYSPSRDVLDRFDRFEDQQ